MGMQSRETIHVVEATPRDENGAVIYRAVPAGNVPLADPFRSFNEYLLRPLSGGFKPHLDQGADVVCYELSGTLQHNDREGFQELIGPGEAFNLVAGTGVKHSETASGDEESHGIMFWSDLRHRHKRIGPEFRKVTRREIPVRDGQGVRIRTLAGENGPIYLSAPSLVLDITLSKNSYFNHPLPLDWNAMAYVLDGSGEFGSNRLAAGPHHLVHLGSGDLFEVHAPKHNAGVRFILLAGQPQRKVKEWTQRIA